MRIEDHLPSSDLERLNDIVPVFESSGGDYLSNDFANLVEPSDDGTIPTEARLQRLLEIPAIRELIKNHFVAIEIQGEAVKIQGVAVKIKMQTEGIKIQGEAIKTEIQREAIVFWCKAGKNKMQREGIKIKGEAIVTKIQREAIEIQGVAIIIKMQGGTIKIQGGAIKTEIQREAIVFWCKAGKIKMQREGIKIQGKAIITKIQREAIEIQGLAIIIKMQGGTIKIQGGAIKIPREAIKKKFKLAETYVAANKKKLSTTLSDYLWPLDEGDTRVEFRSPVPKFESSGGDYLSNDCANLVEPNDDGTIPPEATFQEMWKITAIRETIEITAIRETIEITAIRETIKIQREAIKIEQEAIKKFKLAQLEKYVAANKKKKLSTTLYMWPSDEGDTQVEFRSPVPEFESSGGDYLSNDCANLVEPNDDGTIPQKATFQLLSKITAIREAIPTEATFQPMVKFQREAIEMFKLAYLEKYAAENKKKKLSTVLSDYLWPSDEGDTRVEFRSPVPELPPPGELRFVLSNTRAASRWRKRKADGEYCLAACDDGTVKWIHESECVSQNHVWTVRLFEHRVEGVLYLRDELRRPEKRNVYNHCTIIGGNVNNGSGKQIIGRVAVEY